MTALAAAVDNFHVDGHADVVGGAVFESNQYATGTLTSPTHANIQSTGMIVVLDITDVTGGATVIITIQGVDPASGKVYTILASASKNATGTTVLRVHPNLTASANLIAQDMVPASWNIKATVGTAAATFSVGVILTD